MINILKSTDQVHKPVLLEKVCQAFGLFAPLNNQAQGEKKQIIVDATLGGGGHASEFIRRGAYVLGIDTDEKMVKIAGENLQETVRKLACPTGNFDNFFKIIKSNFININKIVQNEGIKDVDGILFDLGISSYHYLFEKGFSFQNKDVPLDMRLSESDTVTASDLLNALSKKQLLSLFSEVLPYKRALKLSNLVIDSRGEKRIESVGDFLEILNKESPFGFVPTRRKISSPTLPFMALRIAVNSELDNLKTALIRAWSVLKSGGTLAVISFHSGEDRIVKSFISLMVTGKEAMDFGVIIPDSFETDINPRSRSAKLRIAKKL